MAKATLKEIKWLSDAEAHDYSAAQSYLSLIYGAVQVRKMVAKLRRTSVVQFNAKDIYRASQLSLLGVSNSHVAKDREKIRRDQRLAPLLLLRDALHGKVIIADGYHRLCAIYSFDEDAWIKCKIV